MENNHHKIKDIQLSFMIIGAYVAYNFMDAGKDMYKYARTGGWFSMFFVFLICVIIFRIIVYTLLAFEGETSITIFPKLLGKKLAYFLFLIYGIDYILIASANIRFSGEVIKYTVLPTTPLKITCFLMAALTFYALLKKLPTIVRLSEIYGYLGLGIIVLIAIIMATNIDFYNIRPFFAKSDLDIYFTAIPKLYNSFIGLDVLFLLPLNKKINGKFKNNGIITLFVMYILFVFIGTITIGVMGTSEIDNNINIFFVASRIVNVESLDFLRRLDGFFYIGWFVTIFLAIIIYGYIATIYLEAFFKNIIHKDKIKGIVKKVRNTRFLKHFSDSYSFIAFTVTFSSLLLSFVSKNIQDVFFFQKKLSYIYLFISTLVPVYIGYLTWIKRKNSSLGEGGIPNEGKRVYK